MSIEISAGFGQKYLFRKREDFFAAMKAELDSMKASFYKLGMYLSEAYVKHYNIGTGVDDFFVWVEDIFGLGKSTCYNLMRVYNVFRDRNDHERIDERYSGFSQTQLVELLPAADWLDHIKFVKPTDSCSDLRKVVKISKSMYMKAIGDCADSKEYIGRFGAVLNSSQLEKPKKEKPLKGADAYNAVYAYLLYTVKPKLKLEREAVIFFNEFAHDLAYNVLHL